MTNQSIVVESVDFNGKKLRYVKDRDPLFVFCDISAALGYASPDGLMRYVSKTDIERIRIKQPMNAIRWSALRNIFEKARKPVESKRLHDFIVENILPSVERKLPRSKVKPLVKPFGGRIAGWRDGRLITTSVAISDRVKCRHDDVMAGVFAHRSEIEQFGVIVFDQESFITNNGIEQHQIAILDEKQAAALLACMHKLTAKDELTRAFYEISQNKPAPISAAKRMPVLDASFTKTDSSEPSLAQTPGVNKVVSVPKPEANALVVASAVGQDNMKDGIPTMSSLEMVEFINSQRGEGEVELRHDHFMAKVPKVLGDAAPKFSGTAFYTNGTGAKVSRPCYRFPKREACLMAMSYSYDLQAKVFDRMTALERQQASKASVQSQFAIPQTLHEALQLASNIEKERVAAVAMLAVSNAKLAVSDVKLAIAEPKAEALDVIANTDGLYSLQEAGKALGQPPNKFIDWLRDEVGNWIYKRNRLSKNMPFADKERDGYLVVKSVSRLDRNGEEKMEPQTMVTPKGLAKIAILLKDIPPMYITNPSPASRPRGMAKQAIERAFKSFVPAAFEDLQTMQQAPLF